MAMTKKIPASLVFDGAGYIELIRYLPDGTLSTKPEDHYTSGPVLSGAIDVSWSKATSEIKDENSEWPGAQRGGQVTSNVTVNFNSQDPEFERYTKGAVKKVEEDYPVRYMNRSYAVVALGESAGFGFALTENIKSVDASDTVMVRDAMTNADLTAAESKEALAAGSYYLDAASKTVYLPESEVGKSYYVSYTGLADVIKYTYPEGRAIPAYMMMLGGYLTDPSGTGESIWGLKTYDKVSLGGDANDATRQMEPGSSQVSFAVQKPRAGREAISMVYVPEG